MDTKERVYYYILNHYLIVSSNISDISLLKQNYKNKWNYIINKVERISADEYFYLFSKLSETKHFKYKFTYFD